MQKIALSIAAGLAFVLGFTGLALAFESGQECPYHLATPNSVFVELTAAEHPDLTESQVTTLARLYETGWRNQKIAQNVELGEQARELGERSGQIVTEMIGAHLYIFEIMPEVLSVRDRTAAEEAAGLSEVSAELLPEVREVAGNMLAISLFVAELSEEVSGLTVDSFLLRAEADDFAASMEAFNETMCTLERVVELMEGVSDMFPHAAALTFVERLRY